jgi:hypothetical protein
MPDAIVLKPEKVSEKTLLQLPMAKAATAYLRKVVASERRSPPRT